MFILHSNASQNIATKIELYWVHPDQILLIPGKTHEINIKLYSSLLVSGQLEVKKQRIQRLRNVGSYEIERSEGESLKQPNHWHLSMAHFL